MTLPDTLNPRAHQPDLGAFGAYTPDDVIKALKTFRMPDVPAEELQAYVTEDAERFLQTIHLIPQGEQTVLEIGANPYFMTLLARWFRTDTQFSLTNFNNGNGCDEGNVTGPDGDAQTHKFNYDTVNIETGSLPHADASFDVVLFCEVLEHLQNDPMHALMEISRVLRPGGALVMTTPNVARLENVARVISGHNLYDPYSGHGPYGRHNREYTRHELHQLLTHCGFEPDAMFTADVHTNRALDYCPSLLDVAPMLTGRANDLGQYHFTRSIKRSAPNALRPAWLYRSLPPEQLKT